MRTHLNSYSFNWIDVAGSHFFVDVSRWQAERTINAGFGLLFLFFRLNEAMGQIVV